VGVRLEWANRSLWSRLFNNLLSLGAPLLLCSTAHAQSLPDGPSKELVDAVCTACHDSERIIKQHKTKAEWQDKVLEMLQECPDVVQQERDRIIEYLAKNFFKKVNVNKAPSSDLAAALEIAPKDADAIVRYREQSGNFKSLDDLKKVPGLDISKIQVNKERLEYE
jgi:competence protein ComEA